MGREIDWDSVKITNKKGSIDKYHGNKYKLDSFDLEINLK